LPSAPLCSRKARDAHGIITDPSQANLPGVSLALTNEATGVTNGRQQHAGEYTFRCCNRPVRLTVDAKGFRRTRGRILLESARVSRLDVKMQIGQVNEVVEVSARRRGSNRKARQSASSSSTRRWSTCR